VGRRADDWTAAAHELRRLGAVIDSTAEMIPPAPGTGTGTGLAVI